MSRLARWIYSVGFFLAMCGMLAAGTYQYKDNLSIPYNINLFTCGSASCTSMVLQNSSGTELFNGANPGAVLATIQNILVSPISVGITNSPTVSLSGSPVSVGIASGSSPVNVTGNFSATIASPAAMNLMQVQNVLIASPNTYGVAPVGSVEGVNAFVTNNVNVTPPSPLNVTVGTFASPQGVAVVNNVAVTTPTPLGVTLPASPLSVGIAGPTPLAVTLPASPISVGIAGPTPLNVTIATGTNITQIAGNNIASPTGYGTAPVGSVQGVNAFVTNNVAVTTPTPFNVVVGSPLNVTIAGPTPLAVTLPSTPVLVAISSVSSPVNITGSITANSASPTNVNLDQINGQLIASPQTYGVAPVGSVLGVNAFVTNAVNATTTPSVSPQNVTIASTPLNVTIGGTPLNVTIASTPQNMTLATGVNITQIAGNNIASPTGYGTAPVGSVQGVNAFITNAPSVTTTPAVSPQNVTLAGPTPLAVTLPSSPTSVVIGGPTPLAITLPASPISVGIAGPTPLNVTVGGITSPQNVTLQASPLSVTVTPIGLAIGVANPPSAVTAYIATNAYALTGSLFAIGATPGIVGSHQLASAACSSPTPNGTPASAYLRFFDTTPHASGFDIAITVGTQSLGVTNLAVVGSPIQQTQITFPPPGIQFNKGIVAAFTQGAVGSSTAVGYNIHCSFSYN